MDPALKKHMFYVYILKSDKTDKLYIGFTTNIVTRVSEHNDKKSMSTKTNTPYQLVYFEGYRSRADALRREKNLKYFGQAYRRLKERISDSLQGAF